VIGGAASPAVLLCDADGCLFPSEEPAFAASVRVTNALMEHLGAPVRFTAEDLRVATTGQNFRTTAARLARAADRPLPADELEAWIAREQDEVTRHLRTALSPDPAVAEALRRIARDCRLALVSSSALGRIEACLEATALEDLFPPEARFSAEDSLAVPRGKPDPAIYAHALDALEIDCGQALAIEDSTFGARAAIRAGIETVGNLVFVPAGERRTRAEELTAEGVAALIDDWAELEALMDARLARVPRA
jgi:HAD superfamily hydrolase (TIGR01509 family)